MTGRDDYIYGLRALADWLERHPDMPVPSTGRTSVTSLLFMPADRQAATAILAALPVKPETWRDARALAEDAARFLDADDDVRPREDA